MTTTILDVDTPFTPGGETFRLQVTGGDRFDLYTRADASAAWAHAGNMPNGTAHDGNNPVPNTEYKVKHRTRRPGLTPVITLTEP